MPEISLNQIYKSYGAVQVLKGLSLEVHEGMKLGIVGGNGCGKTTLFRVISGEEPYEKGQMHLARNRRIGVLDQLPQHPEGTLVRTVIQTAFSDLLSLKERLDALVETLTDGEEQVRRFGVLQTEFEHRGGYELDVRFNRVIHGLGIPEEMLERPFEKLSGGEKTRVSLAQIILRETDVLLLDEPTNHLDIPSVEWLESFLSDYSGTVLMISHDRYFLDQVTSHICEIDNGLAQVYPGNYSAYSAQREQQRVDALARYETEQKKIRQLEAAAKRLHDWANRADNAKMHRQAFSIEKRVERLQQDGTEKPRTEKNMKNRFRGEAFRGDEVISIENLHRSFGNMEVLRGVSFILYGGDRMALLGPNGCGKTTLLRTILEELSGDSGSIRIGQAVRHGYLPQEVVFEVPERHVLDTLRYAYPMDVEKARNLLAGYRFFGNDVFKTVSSLSGGEKSRLKLCLLMQENVNLLVLDEPTNHLDLHSREWIEEALDAFEGTILFVSHDRYFIRRFANRIAEMNDGLVNTWQFDWTEWLAWKAWKAKQVDTDPQEDGSNESGGKTGAARERLAAKERQREISVATRRSEELEQSIQYMEERMAELDREMVGQATDFVRLQELAAEKEALEKGLPERYDEWEQAQRTLMELSGEDAVSN